MQSYGAPVCNWNVDRHAVFKRHFPRCLKLAGCGPTQFSQRQWTS